MTFINWVPIDRMTPCELINSLFEERNFVI